LIGRRFWIKYAKDREVADLDQLQMARSWERAIKASSLPFESGGGRRPRFGIAAPLPSGYTSEAELLDFYLAADTSLADVRRRLEGALPEGLRILDIKPVSPVARPLQALVLWSRYDVELYDALPRADLAARVERLLGQRECIVEDMKEGKKRRHDIRPGIADLRIEDAEERPRSLAMTLRAGQQPNVRPEQVTAALGLAGPSRVHRRRLILGGLSPVQLAWRSSGRFQER
jgi:radical SAM-linked protein